MATPQEQENQFYEERRRVADQLAARGLKDNPNVTYGDLLSPKELELAAHLADPSLNDLALSFNLYTPSDINKIKQAMTKQFETRVAPYNRAPIEYDMREFHPEYMQRLDEWNSPEGVERRQMDQLRYNRPPSPPPSEPWGIDRARKIAAKGFDPRNELQFDDFGEGASFRTKLAFGPRNMTAEQIKLVGEQHGLKGDYRYINPSDPSLGVLYKPEGEEDFQLINTPYATGEDVYNFLVQEAPAIAGDIGLTVWAARKFTPAGAASETLFKKAGKTLGLSGAAALGATAGDWLRLVAGYKMGAHDMDPDEMLKEAGVVGAWAFAGTAAIGLSADAIIKTWKAVTKTDVPPAMLKEIDQAYRDAAAREKGEDVVSPGMLYGDEVSVKEIRSQIQDLVDRYGAQFPKEGYNPTMPAQAGTQSGADLETLFLKYADDPGLRKLYEEIKKGNKKVIDEFVRVLGEKIGPSPTGPATGATVSEGLRVLAQKDIDAFTDEAYEMIDKVRLQVGGAEDAAAAGAIIKQVDNPEASSGPIFERFQTRLNEIRKSYVKPFNEDWQKALSNERYTNLKTGAGYTRKPTQDWLSANKGDATKLFKSIDGDEAVDSLFQQLPTGAKSILNRLRGIGKKGQFESPSFTLQELNDARVALNDFASNLPEHKKGIAKYARGLERGLEKQMNQLLKEGASAESGIKITQTKALRDWMRANDYGEDLIAAWKNQTEALRLSNSEAIRSIIQQQRPEKIAEYVFNTTAKGSRTNTPMTDLMKVLEKEGSDEVLQLQEGLTAHIQREVLDAPNKTPFQIAKDYRQFIKDHEGTLKSVFGEEKFTSRFGTVKSFNDKVIKTLDNIETDIARIEARFGLATVDPDKRVTNIVESILATGRTTKQSGRVLEDVEYLRNLVKDNPELQKQIAQVTKRYVMQNMIKPRRGGGWALEADDLNRLLTDGFGPEDVVGERLTFESFMNPLLGKEGPEFIKNLKVLNSMVQRELGAEPSEKIIKELQAGEYGLGSNIEGARFLQRMLIAPLTQTGRRITALTNRQSNNSKTLLGEMLLDQDVFNRVMNMMRGRESMKSMIRFFTSYGLATGRDPSGTLQDIGDELQYYDTVEKKQRNPENKDMWTEMQELVGAN
jgi:hypothetical protein